MITEHLDWNPNINSTVTKANICLCIPNETTIIICTCSMSNKRYLKSWMVQRKEGRFIKHDYSRLNSVTRMIHEFGWKKPRFRRKDIWLTILYKMYQTMNYEYLQILIAYLPIHWHSFSKFYSFLLHGDSQQIKQALSYVSLHISQCGWLLVNVFYPTTNV